MTTPQILHFQFDPKQRLKPSSEPLWKDQIDRWYQLDETSFALCDAVFAWQEAKTLHAFDELVFLSMGGSNLADAEFVATVPASPSKFVYTLANIGPSVVSHLLKWSGPVFCYCPANADDEADTLKRLLVLAHLKNQSQAIKTLILESIPRLNQQGYRDVYGYFVS